MTSLRNRIKKEYQKYLEAMKQRQNEKGHTVIINSELEITRHTEKTIRFGVIGTGHVFDRWMHDFLLLPKSFNISVKGVYSFDSQMALRKAEQYKIPTVYKSYREMLEDPDINAVYIATPNHVHCLNAVEALRAGKHVLCEKPIAVNAKELEKMYMAADKAGCFLMEGLWMRTLPVIRKLKEIVSNGEIGEVKIIETSCCNSDSPARYPSLYNPKQAGGALMDVGCYGLHFVKLFMNEATELSCNALLAETGVDSVSTVILKNEQMIATVTQSIGAAGGAKAIIHGTKGSIDVPLFLYPSEFTVNKLNGFKKYFKFDKKNRYYGYAYEIANFADCIRSDKYESELVPRNDVLLVNTQMETIRYDCGIRLGSELDEYE